jgi:hypothetical protein
MSNILKNKSESPIERELRLQAESKARIHGMRIEETRKALFQAVKDNISDEELLKVCQSFVGVRLPRTRKAKIANPSA